jgi:hypothetical protein
MQKEYQAPPTRETPFWPTTIRRSASRAGRATSTPVFTRPLTLADPSIRNFLRHRRYTKESTMTLTTRALRPVALSLAAVLLIIAIGTWRRELSWTSASRGTVSIANGAVMLFRVPPGTFPDCGYSPGWMSRPYASHPRWAPTWQSWASSPGGRITIPFWIPILLLAAPAGWAAARRGRPNHGPNPQPALA